jgi:hypothetical protein
VLGVELRGPVLSEPSRTGCVCITVNTIVRFYVAQTSRTLHILYDKAKKGFFVGKFLFGIFFFRFLETGVIFMTNCAAKEPLHENMLALLVP